MDSLFDAAAAIGAIVFVIALAWGIRVLIEGDKPGR